ncbi:hypothetical protein SDC9_154364 [bioreactor metagenome]|uniref:Uncharacterized protein n=1 Tax=bioreactor metagenome TaxID=1076179 RepID=A0A645EYH7_9ZZZZ
MVLVEVLSLRPAVGSVIKFFAERHADAHLHAAVYLPVDEAAVYALPHVMDGKVFLYLDQARKFIHPHLREVNAE